MALSLPEKRRLGILRISPVLFVSLFMKGKRPGYEVTKDGLPADAKLINIHFGMSGCIEILLESAAFDEVPVGGIVPDLPTPTVRVVNNDGY